MLGIQRARRVITACRESDSGILRVLLSYAYYKMIGKSILRGNRVLIRGIGRIETGGLVQIGTGYIGFMHKYDRTYLNVNGRLVFRGKFSIGKGCRFDIGKGALAEFGGEGYVNANTIFIIMHGLTVGDGCAISWGCQFLDEDFHKINFPSKHWKDNPIRIGNHVWIGSNVTILRGSVIPDGCVVASGSVVTKAFEKESVLIAGNPATVVKENVDWE
jgi:UDP-3-O-[3-hydroxymyristoyl] glucosamine N-acyltransferase